MKHFFISAALLVTPVAVFAQASDTALMPTDLMQRTVNVLVMEGGTTAISAARTIHDCMANQSSGTVHMANPQDTCPQVTAALKAREDAAAAAKPVETPK